MSEAARRAIDDALKLDWHDFVDAVFAIDGELISKGVEPQNRPIQVAVELNRRAHRSTVFGGGPRDPVVDVVHKIFEIVYGQNNLGVGAIHVGTLMLRDVFYPVRVPMVFGRVGLDLWAFVDGLKKETLEVSYDLSPQEYFLNTDQLIDIFDFGWAVQDTGSVARFGELLSLAQEQIEAASHTLQGTFSRRVAVQGAAYAIELTGKALLSKKGRSDSVLRQYNHNLPDLFQAVCQEYPGMNSDLVSRSVLKIPKVVDQRYNFSKFKRLEIGEVLRFAQYLLGECGRQISERDIRSCMTPRCERVFPSASQ